MTWAAFRVNPNALAALKISVQIWATNPSVIIQGEWLLSSLQWWHTIRALGRIAAPFDSERCCEQPKQLGEEQIGGAPMAPLQWRHLYIYALVDLGRDKHKGNILRILQRNRFTRATVEVYQIHTSPHTTNLRKPSTRGPRVCVNLTQFMAHPLCKVLKA